MIQSLSEPLAEEALTNFRILLALPVGLSCHIPESTYLERIAKSLTGEPMIPAPAPHNL